MFDFVRKHTRVLQFILVLLIFPSFVFFGIQGYERFNDAGNAAVAKVGGLEIKRAEWDAAHRSQVERMRQQMPGVDASFFETPEVRRQVLDALVRERVLFTAVEKQHLVTPDARLQRLFASDPSFAPFRNADGSLNRDTLIGQGLTSEQFARRLRQELTLRQVLGGVEGSAPAPEAATAAAFDALLQQREIEVQRFDAKDYRAKVAPTDAQIEAYYKDPANAAQFEAPEEATIEYAVLDAESLAKGVGVAEDDLRRYYAENASRYATPQERRARHILLKADKDAPADVKAKARAKAEQLLAELRGNPAAFAELARKNSEDPGSAANGGDLGFFGRGAMVKPFEDAAFALSKGAISELVESDFGYHVIQLTDVRGGEKKPFEAVRAEIEAEAKKQLAQRRFTEAAVDFTNMVYEQSDSLKPVVDKYKLELKTAQSVRRTPAPGASGALANVKFLAAIFGNDALRSKRNTEAVEIGGNQLASARVLQHSPAHRRTLDEVKSQIRERLVARQAAALAKQDGEARLAALRAAPETALPGGAKIVSRARAGELPQEIVDAALRAPAAKLPAFAGVDLHADGFAVIRIAKLLGRDPAGGDAARARAQYAQAWADAEAQAYYAALKARHKATLTSAADAASAPSGN